MVPITSAHSSSLKTYLAKFRDIDETSEIFKVTTFVIETAKIKMLGIVTLPQREKGIGSISPYDIDISHDQNVAETI